MADDRCFRINELDIVELREQFRDEKLIASFTYWMKNFAHRIDDVISHVSVAFADTKLGDGIGLFEANGIDDYAPQEELQRLRASDEKLNWSNISYSDLARCYSSPWFFNPQGFVFHLPAFLIAELNDKHHYGFINRLFEADERPLGWSELLTVEQKTAVAEALEVIRLHPEYIQDIDAIDAKIQKLRAKATLTGKSDYE